MESPICIDKVIADKDPYVATNRLMWEKGWEPGQTVNISFLNGDSQIHKRVKEVSCEWLDYANLKFNFLSGETESDIRIAFSWKGDENSWSYIGTDAKVVESSEPTMNFGRFPGDYRISTIVLHEFGHALGLIHEFQNPAGGILWNKAAVYKYFMAAPINWTKDQIDYNLFVRYNKAISNFTQFDAYSIMIYRIPFEFSGLPLVWNKELSKQDKSIMPIIYPLRGTNSQ